jgi:Short C-terminal domain
MVFRKTMLGEKPALWLSLVALQLQTWTDTVQSGGGFIGGGFGGEGAAKGILEASVLNALTSRRREYALLGAFTQVPDGSRRDVIFGFQDITESDLREQLAKAVPLWAEDFVQRFVREIGRQQPTAKELAATYVELDGMRARGMLTAEQHSVLEAELKKHGERPSSEGPRANPGDRPTQLKTLAELRDSGALTEDEFQAEKARILDS